MKQFQYLAPGTENETFEELAVRYFSVKINDRPHTFQNEKYYMIITIFDVQKTVEWTENNLLVRLVRAGKKNEHKRIWGP